jgi:hypothetical protein
MAIDPVKELSHIESLKLALEYSTSEKHKKSLLKRIDQIEAKKEIKKEVKQLSFK